MHWLNWCRKLTQLNMEEKQNKKISNEYADYMVERCGVLTYIFGLVSVELFVALTINPEMQISASRTKQCLIIGIVNFLVHAAGFMHFDKISKLLALIVSFGAIFIGLLMLFLIIFVFCR